MLEHMGRGSLMAVLADPEMEAAWTPATMTKVGRQAGEGNDGPASSTIKVHGSTKAKYRIKHRAIRHRHFDNGIPD